jgi:hypothetical protein
MVIRKLVCVAVLVAVPVSAITSGAASAKTAEVRATVRTVSPMQQAYKNYVAAVHAAKADIKGSQFAKKSQGTDFVNGIVNYSLAQALSLTTDQPLMEVLPRPDEHLGFNNPDNLYYTSRISDQKSYTITGHRGTSTGFLIEALAGLPGTTATAGQVTSSVSDSNIHYAPDGSFSITVGATQPATGDWLPLVGGTDNLLVRFTFQDWATEIPGSIAISENGGPGNDVVDMTPTVATAMLNDAANSISLQTQFYVHQGSQLSLLGPNRLIGPFKAAGQQGTDVQQWNVTGNYSLKGSESLIIKEKSAPTSVALYSGIVLATPLLDSLEFVHHEASVNHDQAYVDSDGYIYYVVSSKDPGVPNWLDDQGQNLGTVFARWQGVTGTLGSDYSPTLTVVKSSALRSVLPSDTPTVTISEQSAIQAQRTEELESRFANADPARHEILRRLQAIESLLGRALPHQTLPSESL